MHHYTWDLSGLLHRLDTPLEYQSRVLKYRHRPCNATATLPCIFLPFDRKYSLISKMGIKGRLKNSTTTVTLDAIRVLTCTHISCIKLLHLCLQEQCFIFKKISSNILAVKKVPYKFRIKCFFILWMLCK